MEGDEVVDGEINGLGLTPARLALLRAVDGAGGRIYYEAPSKAVWDKATAYRVTERVREMVDHGWIRPTNWDTDECLPGELKRLVYYRLTELGQTALSRGQQ